jgi:hypothetical protein
MRGSFGQVLDPNINLLVTDAEKLIVEPIAKLLGRGGIADSR